MERLRGFNYYLSDTQIPKEQLVSECLAKVFGEENASYVLDIIRYMAFACCECKEAKKRLEQADEFGMPYIEYTDYGATVKLRYYYSDGICDIYVVEYSKIHSQSP